jgi:hypothetical protein
MNTTDFPPLAPSSRFPANAADLVAVTEKPHPDFPEFGPGKTWLVSRADIATATAKNLNRIPLRNAAGRRHLDLWQGLAGKRRETYAAAHGWPFMMHVSYLDPEISTLATP